MRLTTMTRHLPKWTALLLGLAAAGTALAGEAPRQSRLGIVHNEVSRSLVPGTHYDNIVNIGCGWASGINFAGGVDWLGLLPAALANPSAIYDLLTDPAYVTTYQNKYALQVQAALEARDGEPVRLFDVAKGGHTSPYGRFEIDELDGIIDAEFGGQLTGNTLVLYEYGPPDFIRLISMLFDRDPALNPIATAMGGDPFPPGTSAFGDSYWQARFAAELGGDPGVIDAVLERYAGHFMPTVTGATPYVDETAVLGPPNSNMLTVADRFFASYQRDYRRLLNGGGRYGNKVDIIVVGNENPYEGGNSFGQYARSVSENFFAVFPCTLLPTFFGCRPDTVATAELGIDPDFVHPFADQLTELSQDYSERMREQAREEGVSMINVVDLFAGHHSRFDDPTSPSYVADDPTYWAYMAEINALGHEVMTDVILHLLDTGRSVYQRPHSSEFVDEARAHEFDGVYGY